jgi:hypothetical protein
MSYLEALDLTGYVTGKQPLADHAKLEVDGQSEVFSKPWKTSNEKPAAPETRFPVERVGEVHAAFLNESRTRGRVQRSVQEIRRWRSGLMLRRRCLTHRNGIIIVTSQLARESLRQDLPPYED